MTTVQTKNRLLTCTAIGALACFAACGDDDPDPVNGGNPPEVITTVNLTFTPAGGGTAIMASFRDPDGPGGDDPTVTDPSPLSLGTDYDLDLELLNESEVPTEDKTVEIQAEAEEHQFFFTGDAVGSAITVAYADVESDYATNAVGDDLPVGLRATVTTTSTGSGTLRVVLKHQPPINDTPVKTASSGINDGDTDIDVSFTVTVQ